MKSLRYQVVAGLFIFAIMLSACSPAVSTPVAAKPTLTPIKIKAGVPPNLSNAPFYIAQDEGYFAEQGLDVEFVTIASSTKSVPLLISGDVDLLAGSTAVASLNAITQNTNIKIVADKGHNEPGKCTSIAYVVRPGFLQQHPLNSPADLKGLKINANLTAFAGYQIETLLAQGGLTINDVEVSNLSADAVLQAVEQGTIDVAAFLEPELTQEVLAGRVVVWTEGSLARTNADKQIAYVTYGPTLLNGNLDAGKRFMVAYLKAVKQYDQGPTDQNVAIVAKYTQIDPAILKQACWQYIAEDGQIDTQSIVDFEAWAVQKKLMDKAATVDQFWDHAFIDYAKQVLNTP